MIGGGLDAAVCVIGGGVAVDGGTAVGRLYALPVGRGAAGEGFAGDEKGVGLAGIVGASLKRAGLASSVVNGPIVDPTVGIVGIVGAYCDVCRCSLLCLPAEDTRSRSLLRRADDGTRSRSLLWRVAMGMRSYDVRG